MVWGKGGFTSASMSSSSPSCSRGGASSLVVGGGVIIWDDSLMIDGVDDPRTGEKRPTGTIHSCKCKQASGSGSRRRRCRRHHRRSLTSGTPLVFPSDAASIHNHHARVSLACGRTPTCCIHASKVTSPSALSSRRSRDFVEEEGRVSA